MPINPAAAHESGPAAWPALETGEVDGAARVVETWPAASHTLTDIEMVISGSGPDVDLAMTAGQPASCVWRAEQSSGYQRAGWDVAIRAEVCVRADAAHFHVEERLVATLNGQIVADAAHAESVPRRWM